MNLETILRGIAAIGAVTAKLPEVSAIIQAAASMLSEDDQAVAKEALADLIADNDEGHRRLQEKLRAAR